MGERAASSPDARRVTWDEKEYLWEFPVQHPPLPPPPSLSISLSLSLSLSLYECNAQPKPTSTFTRTLISFTLIPSTLNPLQVQSRDPEPPRSPRPLTVPKLARESGVDPSKKKEERKSQKRAVAKPRKHPASDPVLPQTLHPNNGIYMTQNPKP